MDLLEYNILYRNTSSLIKIYFLFILLITLCLLIFYNIEYKNYYKNSGIVIEDDCIKINVSNSDVDVISNNRKLKIKDREFAYTVKSISDVMYSVDYYREIILQINLDDDLNIKNNIVKFNILLDKQTILEYIFHKIGG